MVPPVRDAAAASATPHVPPPITPTPGRDMATGYSAAACPRTGSCDGTPGLAVRGVTELPAEVQPGAHRVLDVVDAHVLDVEALAHAARGLRGVGEPVVVVGPELLAEHRRGDLAARASRSHASGRPAKRESAMSAAYASSRVDPGVVWPS